MEISCLNYYSETSQKIMVLDLSGGFLLVMITIDWNRH